MASVNPRKRKAYVFLLLPAPTSLTVRGSVDFSEKTVTVIVGTDQKIFTMHPSTLTNSSKFFQSALSGTWIESQNRSIILPESRSRVFQSYAAYVYNGEIDICAEELDETNDPEGRNRFYQLTELYALADVTLDDKNLRNTVIDAILDLENKTGYQPAFSAIKHAYENSPGATPLCRLLLDNALAATHPAWLNSVWSMLPEAYVRALMHGWAHASCDRKITYQSSVEHPRCRYHEHDNEVLVSGFCDGPGKTMALKLSAKKKAVISPRALRSRT